MAAKNKADLKTDIDDDIKIGVPGGILAGTDNARRTDDIDSALNIVEPALQEIDGPISFKSDTLTREINGITRNIFANSATVFIESDQDWIDNTTFISATERRLNLNGTYTVCGNVSRSFTLLTNGFSTLLGDNPNIDVDIYTGTGTAWVDSAAFSGLTVLRCSCKGVAGTGSKFIDQANGAFILSTDSCFIEYDDLGSSDAIINVHVQVAFGSAAIPVLVGYSITAVNTPTISFTSCAIRMDDTAVLIGLDVSAATSISSIVVGIAFRGGAATGTIGLKVAPNSANLLGSARGLVRDCNFSSVDTPTDGLSINDIKWILRDNTGIQNTMPDAHAICMDRVTPTAISTVDTPTEVGGGSVSADPADDWIDEGGSQFTLDIETGRITYNGRDTFRAPIRWGCTLEPDAGTNKNIYVYIGFGLSGASNPTALQNSRSESRIDTNDPKPIGTFTQITFNTGDYISPMVALKTGESLTDILCTNNKITVN